MAPVRHWLLTPVSPLAWWRTNPVRGLMPHRPHWMHSHPLFMILWTVCPTCGSTGWMIILFLTKLKRLGLFFWWWIVRVGIRDFYWATKPGIIFMGQAMQFGRALGRIRMWLMGWRKLMETCVTDWPVILATILPLSFRSAQLDRFGRPISPKTGVMKFTGKEILRSCLFITSPYRLPFWGKWRDTWLINGEFNPVSWVRIPTETLLLRGVKAPRSRKFIGEAPMRERIPHSGIMWSMWVKSG